MKKFSKNTGNIMGKISLFMIFFAIFFIFFIFTKYGWWFDHAVFSPFMRKFHIPYTAWFWFLKLYVAAAILLAILSGFFSEK